MVESDPDWWRKVAPTAEELEDVSHGYKIVLLLHILACAQRLDEKVLIFSQCLRTLNLLETVLAKAWQELVPSIADEFPNQSLGRWTKNKDYLRIDGSTSSQDRGNMVMTFNTAERNPFRAFLISVRAGGIGINLVRFHLSFGVFSCVLTFGVVACSKSCGFAGYPLQSNCY